MARSIVRAAVSNAAFTSGAMQETPGETLSVEPDKYASRLLKYVPTEVIVLYAALNNAVAASRGHSYPALLWTPFIICLIGVYIYLWRMQGKERRRGEKIDKICWVDIHISAVAFLIWALTLGGPFVTIDGFPDWGPIASAIALPTFTFAAPLLRP